MATPLEQFGLVPYFAQQTSPDEREQGRVARVTEVQRALIRVSDGSEERSVSIASTLRNAAIELRPTVGDWVVLDNQSTHIERVLDRKSLFRRVAAGDKADIQLIAANIDVLFVVTSCNEEFKESRLERYLALAVAADVMPVVVLTKSDLTDDPQAYAERARRVHAGIAVEVINALNKSSMAGLSAWIEPGCTVALVGSSGVGKSTILNSLAEAGVAATSEIRDDDKKGRHTTSHRSLHRLPGGGLLIDVPGMRELKVAEVNEALPTVFSDIAVAASNCRFSDCQHESEPGCAVRESVVNGEIDERRFRNYLKLQRENERHNHSLAENRSQGRAFAKVVKQSKALKKNQQSNN